MHLDNWGWGLVVLGILCAMLTKEAFPLSWRLALNNANCGLCCRLTPSAEGVVAELRDPLAGDDVSFDDLHVGRTLPISW